MAMTVRYTVVNGEILAEKRSGARKVYVPDPLGSTVALLDSSQTKTDTYTYWPFGEERSSTGSTPTPFRFVGTQGYYRDNASRSYVRARHYQPGYGRWLTMDPIGYHAGGINLYTYVKNNPVLYTDPKGLQIIICSIPWPPEPPGPGVPPSACSTYDSLCEEGDRIACGMAPICRSFGDGPWVNCVRKCLLEAFLACEGSFWCEIKYLTYDHARCFVQCPPGTDPGRIIV